MSEADGSRVTPFVVICIVASFLGCFWSGNGLAGPSARRALDDKRPVVSYLVSAASDADAWIPDEPGPWAVPKHGWQWRLYDPRTGNDRLFLELSSFPLLIRWDSLTTSVDFISGNRILRAPWKMGARVHPVATLPADSGFCDFWQDPRGGWHLITQHMAVSMEGREPMPVAARWDRNFAGDWRRAVADSTDPGGYGEGYKSPRLYAGVRRIGTLTIASLLDSMRIEAKNHSLFGGTPETGEERIWVASSMGPEVGLEMGYAFGDTPHAMEPVIWIDRVNGSRREVYGEGQSKDETAGQLALMERARFLLIAAEFSGAYPAVIDMRTGHVLKRVDRLSARAVWMPAPQGFR